VATEQRIERLAHAALGLIELEVHGYEAFGRPSLRPMELRFIS
jgi:hypothetical protein